MKEDQLCRLVEVLVEEGYEVLEFKPNKEYLTGCLSSRLSRAVDLVIAPDGSRGEINDEEERG